MSGAVEARWRALRERGVRGSTLARAGSGPGERRAELMRAAKATSLGVVLGTLLVLAARARDRRGSA